MEKIHFVSVGITRVFLLFRKISDYNFWFILHTKWLLKVQLISYFLWTCSCTKSWENCNSLYKNIYSLKLQKESEQFSLKLLLQSLEKLSVDEKNSKHLQKMLEQKQFENSWKVEKRNPSIEQKEPFLEKVVQNPVALAKTFLIR